MNKTAITTEQFDAMRVANEALVQQIKKLMPIEGEKNTLIKGLTITRRNNKGSKYSCFLAPSITILIQGSQTLKVEQKTYCYGPFECFINGIDIVGLNNVVEASDDRPMLALSILLDGELVTQMMSEIPLLFCAKKDDGSALSIGKTDPDVFGLFGRLINLVSKPEQLPLMAPLLIRELIAYILLGSQRFSLYKLTQPNLYRSQMILALSWLKDNYTRKMKVEELANYVNMATSTFHRQFKSMTSYSPLQYQKRLRLYEAQRLMLVKCIDANTAGMIVGYESAQQFNREYKRLFGDPPHRDINRLNDSHYT